MSVFTNLPLTSGVFLVVFVLSSVSAQQNFDLPHEIDLESMDEIEDLLKQVQLMFEMKMASKDQQESVSYHEKDGDRDDREKNVEEDPNLSCTCDGLQCSCCHTIQIYSFRQDGCLKMDYIPDRKLVRFSLTIGPFHLFSKEVPATQPRPICVNVPKISRWVSVCIEFNRFESTATSFGCCATFKARAIGITLLNFQLGCFKMQAPPSAVQDTDEVDLPYLEGGKDSAKDPGPIYPW